MIFTDGPEYKRQRDYNIRLFRDNRSHCLFVVNDGKAHLPMLVAMCGLCVC